MTPPFPGHSQRSDRHAEIQQDGQRKDAGWQFGAGRRSLRYRRNPADSGSSTVSHPAPADRLGPVRRTSRGSAQVQRVGRGQVERGKKQVVHGGPSAAGG